MLCVCAPCLLFSGLLSIFCWESIESFPLNFLRAFWFARGWRGGEGVMPASRTCADVVRHSLCSRWRDWLRLECGAR